MYVFNFLVTCSNIIPIVLHGINIKNNQQKSFKTTWVDITCIIIALVNLIIWIWVQNIKPYRAGLLVPVIISWAIPCESALA